MGNFDDLSMAVASFGGNNKVIFDDLEKPSIMVGVPKMKYSDLITGGTQDTLDVFKVDGVEREMLYISKYIKTTLGDLDNEVDVLRHLVRLAADPNYMRDKKPCLPIKKYEQISRKVNEIGCMIGGYYKSLNGSPSAQGGAGKPKRK